MLVTNGSAWSSALLSSTGGLMDKSLSSASRVLGAAQDGPVVADIAVVFLRDLGSLLGRGASNLGCRSCKAFGQGLAALVAGRLAPEGPLIATATAGDVGLRARPPADAVAGVG